MKLSGFGSASDVRFFYFCSLVGGGWQVGGLCMPSTAARRRADLSGAKGVVGRFEPAFLIIAADAAGSVKEGVRAVWVDVDLDPRLDEVGPHRAFGDLQFQRAVGD